MSDSYRYSPPADLSRNRQEDSDIAYRNFKVPFFKKDCISLASRLADSINRNIAEMNKTTDFGQFIVLYYEALSSARHLAKIRNAVKYKSALPYFDLQKYLEEFQWHLRNCMEQNKNRIVRDAHGLYVNWPEKTRSDCEKFSDDFNQYRHVFNEGTIAFGRRMMSELRRDCGVPIFENTVSEQTASGNVPQDFDRMSGTDFECFCADVLRGNGYQNVVVTKRSGDQGADVIAERDGVKYAFQCKRYDGDVGNAAVQEVFTGKQIYKCHVGIVLTNRGFTQSAKEAAASTDILLWDRSVLLQLIESAS